MAEQGITVSRPTGPLSTTERPDLDIDGLLVVNGVTNFGVDETGPYLALSPAPPADEQALLAVDADGNAYIVQG